MLTTYWKVAWRTLIKNKASSLINLFGLTVGLSACLLIGLYIQYQLRFDAFQSKADRIARVIMEYSFGKDQATNKGNFTSTKVAPMFTKTFPEVETAVRMRASQQSVRYQDKLITEANFVFADSSFFDVFAVRFRLGNPKQALNGPHKLILTESTARTYFGAENPMGKILLVGSDSVAYQVTGVVADYPPNSQLKFNVLASFSSLGAYQEKTYSEANYTTYLLLKHPHDLPIVEAKVTPFMEKEMAGSGMFITFHLEPFQQIHLHSPYTGFVPTVSITYLYILVAVAGLILLIVGFTYINISTAQSLERVKEVGVRKVAGARKSQLFWQFMGESGILCVLALVFSVGVTASVLPAFTNFTQTPLSLRLLFTPSFLLVALFIALSISVVAGSYPALLLAGFQPIQVLKGVFKTTGFNRRTQQSLIIFQFTISITLLVATVIVQRQLHFIQAKKLGYDRAHMLVLPLDPKMLPTLSTLKQELRTDPTILRISRSNTTPVDIKGGFNMRSAKMAETEQLAVTATTIDEDYLQTTGLQLIAGQDLTQQDMEDVAPTAPDPKHYHFLLNERAAAQLGWTPTQAVGQRLFLDSSRPGVVKGVVRDFHFESLHQAIKPLVLFPAEWSGH